MTCVGRKAPLNYIHSEMLVAGFGSKIYSVYITTHQVYLFVRVHTIAYYARATVALTI